MSTTSGVTMRHALIFGASGSCARISSLDLGLLPQPRKMIVNSAQTASGASSGTSKPTYGISQPEAIIIAQRLTGGAAALMIANIKTNAAVFFLERPMALTTVVTIEPRTKMEMLPAPVSAPGMIIITPIMASRIHLLLTRETIFRVTTSIAPVLE